VPVLTIGWVACSLHRTTSRLDTIVALRSSFSSTMPSASSQSGASCTIPTAGSDALPRADDGAGLLLAQHGLALAWAGVQIAAREAEGRLPELCQIAVRSTG
jgi:hypothetical protein